MIITGVISGVKSTGIIAALLAGNNSFRWRFVELFYVCQTQTCVGLLP